MYLKLFFLHLIRTYLETHVHVTILGSNISYFQLIIRKLTFQKVLSFANFYPMFELITDI